ncbi:hypothetical protein [Acetobacter tropicalis]|uniref:Uncharacterized protein n=1 Tax=Acetobacter tropicalis TaxID=104102 RepID=A0A252AAH3_9PROT|nr:hypothetical protein [Acetobacter tropicalis]OUI86597.1 hypothetical protein HC62_04030 [Acetobacter tropicalis]
MSKHLTVPCANQAVTLDGIQSALIMLMGEIYEHMDEGHDPAPTHNDCAAWGDGLSWLIKSIGRVRDELRGGQS